MIWLLPLVITACSAPPSTSTDRKLSEQFGKTEAENADFAVWLTALHNGNFGCPAELATANGTEVETLHALNSDRETVIEALRKPTVWVETASYVGPPAVGELKMVINVTGKAPYAVYRALADTLLKPTEAEAQHKKVLQYPHRLFNHIVEHGGRWIYNHRKAVALVAVSVLAPQLFGLSRATQAASGLLTAAEADAIAIATNAATLAPRMRVLAGVASLARGDEPGSSLETMMDQLRSLVRSSKPDNYQNRYVSEALPTDSPPGYTFERTSLVGAALEHILLGPELQETLSTNYLTLLLRGFTHWNRTGKYNFRQWPGGRGPLDYLFDQDSMIAEMTRGSDVAVGIVNRLPAQAHNRAGEPLPGELRVMGPHLRTESTAVRPAAGNSGMIVPSGQDGLFLVPGVKDRQNTLWIQRGAQGAVPQNVDEHRAWTTHWIPIGSVRARTRPSTVSPGLLDAVCQETGVFGLPGAEKITRSMLGDVYDGFEQGQLLLSRVREALAYAETGARFEHTTDPGHSTMVSVQPSIESSALLRWNIALASHFGVDGDTLARYIEAPNSRNRRLIKGWLSTARRIAVARTFVVEGDEGEAVARPAQIVIEDADLVILLMARKGGEEPLFAQGPGRRPTIKNALTLGPSVRLPGESVQAVFLRAEPGDELHVSSTEKIDINFPTTPILTFLR